MPKNRNTSRKFHQSNRGVLPDFFYIFVQYVLPVIAIVFIATISLIMLSDNDIKIPQKEITIDIDAKKAISDYQNAK